MKSKFILSISLVLLVALVVVVSAYTEQIQGDEDKITYTASVRQGWNLLNAGIYANALTSNSDIKEEDISVVFIYSPSTAQYIRIKPNLEESKYNEEKKYYDGWTSKIHSSSAWVYVKRGGMIEYVTDDIISMTQRELNSGWNFVSVTENALGKSLADLKGNCNIQKAYYYLEGYQNLDLATKFPTDMSSQGLLIKVSSDCKLGTSGSSINPPVLPPSGSSPNDNGKYCKDEDGNNQYTRGSAITEPQGDDKPIAHSDSCVAVSDANNYIAFVDGKYYNSASKDCPAGGNCFAADGGDCSGAGCFIAEAYCDGVTQKYKILDCLKGCNKGACIS